MSDLILPIIMDAFCIPVVTKLEVQISRIIYLKRDGSDTQLMSNLGSILQLALLELSRTD